MKPTSTYMKYAFYAQLINKFNATKLIKDLI